MAPTTTITKASQKKSNSSRSGAPSQFQKGSRKGKKAWRKNVDLDDVEEGMEEMRKEEQATGLPLQKQADTSLFVVDTAGDDATTRSAVPALRSFLKPTSANASKQQQKLEYQRLKQLQRTAKRIVADENKPSTSTSAPEPASDFWSQPDEIEKVIQSFAEGDQKDYLTDLVVKRKPRPPRPDKVYQAIALKAVVDPHAGSSYNSHPSAHSELLNDAVQVEVTREKRRLAAEEKKAAIQELAKAVDQDAEVDPQTEMPIDTPAEDDDEEEGVDAATAPVSRKQPKPKTKRDRRVAAKVKAMRMEHRLRAKHRRFLHSINFAKQMGKELDAKRLATKEGMLKRKFEKIEQYKSGLAGKRVGSKHHVPRGDIDVQLTEDMSDSLRKMKAAAHPCRTRWKETFSATGF
ncbi:hypothetical protein FRB99_007041 [Tulasnella sp. 403]|nr:hypothetical protein FRB99_007041 [Tulasnella sp. 403]